MEAESSADSFVRSVTWTAPATAVGNITLYLAVNAVDHDHLANSGDFSVAVSKVLQPYPATAGIGNTSEVERIAVFPNPTSEKISIAVNNVWGRYTLQVLDMTGKQVIKKEIVVNGNTETIMVNASEWPQGAYNIVLQTDAEKWTKQIVKI